MCRVKDSIFKKCFLALIFFVTILTIFIITKRNFFINEVNNISKSAELPETVDVYAYYGGVPEGVEIVLPTGWSKSVMWTYNYAIKAGADTSGVLGELPSFTYNGSPVTSINKTVSFNDNGTGAIINGTTGTKSLSLSWKFSGWYYGMYSAFATFSVIAKPTDSFNSNYYYSYYGVDYYGLVAGWALPTLPTITKTGYTCGWSTSANGSIVYASGSYAYKIVDNLYAVCNANEYTLTANSNGGSIASTTGWTGTGNTATKKVRFGSAYGTLPSATRSVNITYNVNGTGATLSSTTGTSTWTLNGWYTATTGGTKVSTTTTMGSSNTTIYAQWSKSTDKLATVTKTGYTCGWSTSSTGSVVYASGASTNAITSTTTLYAVCNANEYTLTANSNGGSITSTTGWTGTGNSATKKVSFGSEYGTLPSATRSVNITYNVNGTGATLSSTTGTSTWTLNGWYTATTGGTKVSTTTTMGSSNTTIYAQWSKSTDKLATVTKTGYTCGWSTSSTGSVVYASGASTNAITSTTTLYAVCNAKTYTILWKNYDGTILEEDLNVQYGEVPNYDGKIPTRDATSEFTYVFSGWSPTVQKVTGDAIYTALFNSEDILYDVVYDLNGGTSSEQLIYKLKYGEDLPKITEPIRTGYKFDGWSPSLSNKVTGSVTYIAQWINENYGKVIIHYYLDGTETKVSDDVEITGLIGNPFDISSKNIDNFVLVKKPDVEQGSFSTDIQEFIYYYKKNIVSIKTKIISGNGEITDGEEIEYNGNSNSVVIRAADDYVITYIRINGENVDVTNGDYMVLDGFKNVTEDILIEVEFELKNPNTGAFIPLLAISSLILFALIIILKLKIL